jgi:hypothetical protein
LHGVDVVGSEGSSAAIFFWMGVTSMSGSAVERATIVTEPVRLTTPENSGKYIIGFTGSMTLHSVSPTSPMIS